MNLDQITGILRVLLPPILAYVAAKGWISESMIPDIVAAAVTVAAVVWSAAAHTQQAKLASVAAMPDVKGIVVTTHALATETPSPKVVDAASEIPPTVKPKATGL